MTINKKSEGQVVMESTPDFGTYLSQLMKIRNIKPGELAEKLHVDPSLVRKWIAGSRIPPHKSNYCDLLCKNLGLNPHEQFLLKRAQTWSSNENIVRLSDLQKAEDRAAEYKQSLISLLNAIPEAAYLLNPDGRIIAANKITAQHLEISANELIGHNVFNHLPPHLADLRNKLIDFVVKKGVPVTFKDYRDTRCILFSLYPLKNNENMITNIVVYGTDITELETEYAALQENEERFRLMFENSFEPILLTKPDGSILSANPAACSFFQMTEEELCALGKSSLIDPEDNNLFPALSERQLTAKAKAIVSFSLKGGTKRTALASSAQFHDSRGACAAYVMIHALHEHSLHML